MEVGDIVGIKEPNLYTGVGTVKEEHRGVIERFGLDGKLAMVKFPQYLGITALFIEDLIVYELPEKTR